MGNLINKINTELNFHIDLDYRKGSINFFKEKITVFGVRSKYVRKIARKYFPKDKSKQEIFQLCEELLKTNYNEHATIAFAWLFRIRKQFVKEDFYFLEKLLSRYITNWAMCDDFCTHSFGYLITEYPFFFEHMQKNWAISNNRWLRRASAVILIHPIKKKKNLKECFQISAILLQDKDDLVQKGYGWLLKEASKNFQKEIFDFVMVRKDNMPRIALRYAIEKMPQEMKKKAMLI